MRPEYKKEYIDLWKSCKVNDSSKSNIVKWVDKILENKRVYTLIGMALDLPWYLVACIHSLESSLSFKTHLHNGDPLSSRTTHVPAGRPKGGNPPYSWEFSAADALSEKINGAWVDDLNGIKNESIESILFALESYNGFGYKKYHPEVKSPYLWSKTNQYTKGKYVEDGKFDSNAVSSQIGAAAILKVLEENGEIKLSNIASSSEIISPVVNSKSDIKTILKLQIFMNSFDGNKMSEDGKAGPKTKERFKEIFGHDLI